MFGCPPPRFSPYRNDLTDTDPPATDAGGSTDVLFRLHCPPVSFQMLLSLPTPTVRVREPDRRDRLQHVLVAQPCDGSPARTSHIFMFARDDLGDKHMRSRPVDVCLPIACTGTITTHKFLRRVIAWTLSQLHRHQPVLYLLGRWRSKCPPSTPHWLFYARASIVRCIDGLPLARAP